MDLTFFNPHSQSEADFLASFVARREVLDYYLRQLRILPKHEPASHHLIVAPRGYGKTSLLRRLAIAVRVEMDLATNFIALTFREEQHNVISLDVFWRNCLQSLLEAREDEGASTAELEELDAAWAAHAPRQALSRDEQDGDPAWRDFHVRCTRLGRRPVLLIDNLDSLLASLPANHQWSLRGILQQEDGPILMAAAPRFPESTHDREAAFYDFFRIESLDKLSDREVMHSLRTTASRRGPAGRVVLELIDKDPGRIAALNALSGGNPRTLSVLYSVLESHMSADVLSQLSAMLDTFTSWYQDRAADLPSHARAVFDALALHWDPMTAAAVGQVTGLDTTAVSSQISRLEKAGLVEAVALNRRGKGRSGYQLSERFFNIWYLMRNGPRRARQSIKFLAVFLQSCFSTAERRTLARTMMNDGQANPGYALGLAASLQASPLRERLLDYAEAQSSLTGTKEEYGPAIDELRDGDDSRRKLKLPEGPKRWERELAELDRKIERLKGASKLSEKVQTAKALLDRAETLVKLGRPEEAIEVCTSVDVLFGEAAERTLRELVAGALDYEGFLLVQVGRLQQALATCDSVVARFGEASEPALRERVARALVNKGAMLRKLGHSEPAIEAFDSVVARFGESSEPALREGVARALVGNGIALDELGHSERAIEAFDSVVARLGDTSEPALRKQVARALFNKGVALSQLGGSERAIEAFGSVVARLGDASEPALRELVARALFNKGVALSQLGGSERAIEAYDNVVALLGDASEPALRELVTRALFNKGVALSQLGLSERAIEAFDSVVARFDDASEPGLREPAARALVNKGFALRQLGLSEREIEAFDSVVARFDDASESLLREQIARALVNKGATLGQLGHSERAIEAFDDVVARFGDASEPTLRESVAMAFFSKGVALSQLGGSERAIEAYESVVARFGDASEPALRVVVAWALVNKGVALGQLGDSEREIEAFESVVTRFGDASESVLHEHVTRALVSMGTTLAKMGSTERAEAALRRAVTDGTDELRGSAWNALGNLLLDHIGDPAVALVAYESGLVVDHTPRGRAFLCANAAYAAALYGSDSGRASDHVRQALSDPESISPAGRYLLTALTCLQESPAMRWLRIFEQLGLAVESGDTDLWSTYLEDLQRLLWYLIAQGEGQSLRRWMDEAGYSQKYAPLYQAIVAAIDGEDALLLINPETRTAAARIHEGIARRLKLYQVAKGSRSTAGAKRRATSLVEGD